MRQTPSSGFTDVNGGNSQLENIGELKNRGIEVSASAAVMQGDNWALDLGGSFSTNKSEVGLPGEVPEFSVGGEGWIIDGQPVPVIRGDCVSNPSALAEPTIEEDCIYGPNQPTKIFGLNTTISLPKGLTLNARGEYQGGHYVTVGVADNAVGRSVVWAGCNDVYNIAGMMSRS